MSKASEEQLAELHGTIARTLNSACQEREITVEGRTEVLVPSAAHIMAAITFLKNNNITADASTNEDLMALNKSLAARRKKRTLSPSDIERAAEQLDRDLGGHMQ